MSSLRFSWIPEQSGARMIMVSRRDLPITVLLADDTDAVRSDIRRILGKEFRIALVGQAVNFSHTLQMCANLKPAVVLLELHMPDEREFAPALVKSGLLHSAKHVLAMSIWTDQKSSELATSYGATTLLDKTNLGFQLVSVILQLS
jgi:two-component system, NarL family, response regulator NreC